MPAGYNLELDVSMKLSFVYAKMIVIETNFKHKLNHIDDQLLLVQI